MNLDTALKLQEHIDALQRRGLLDGILNAAWADGHKHGYKEGHADGLRDQLQDQGSSRQAEAAAFLSRALSPDEWRPADEVKAEAEAAGITARTLQRLTPKMVERRYQNRGRRVSCWRLRTSPTSPDQATVLGQ